MNTRRQAFLLAGALTATVFTAAAALGGIAHRSPAPQPVLTPVVQAAPPAPARPTQWEDH
jgi:hypothetical protein